MIFLRIKSCNSHLPGRERTLNYKLQGYPKFYNKVFAYFLIICFQSSSVQTSKSIITTDNFVYCQWGWTTIYRHCPIPSDPWYLPLSPETFRKDQQFWVRIPWWLFQSIEILLLVCVLICSSVKATVKIDLNIIFKPCYNSGIFRVFDILVNTLLNN